jgi:hypothetical protein
MKNSDSHRQFIQPIIIYDILITYEFICSYIKYY